MYLVQHFRKEEFLRRLARHGHIQKQRVAEKPHAQRAKTVHVVYLLGHVSVCGGVKIILEHANRLVKHGMRVSLLAHFPKPDWFEIKAEYIQLPFGIELARGIPGDCDVVVASYWDQLGACVEACAAPVVYFEQGDFHLWDWEKVSADKQQLIYNLYQLPQHVITCSETGARKIQEIFNRQAKVFPNALNDQIFYPKNREPEKKYILGVGRDSTPFKRIPDIWEACQLVRQRGYEVEFRWVTPYAPAQPLGTVVINPSQEQLGTVYRQAWAYVCASEYETFPLPPLEAMACGTAVIATPNDGVLAYGVDGVNCLFFPVGDVEALANRMIRLLEDESLYRHLQAGGCKTASLYSWQQIIPKLKAFYQEVAGYQPEGVNSAEDWVQLAPIEADAEAHRCMGQFLQGTAADLIYLPFTYRVGEEFSVVRWRPVFQRKSPLSGQVDYLYCLFEEGSLADYPYHDAVHEVLSENYLAALTKFKQHLDEVKSPLEAAVLLRWVTWCLIKSDHFREARQLLHKGMKLYPAYMDLYYLYSLVFDHFGNTLELNAFRNTVKTLGDAVSFPEYIYNIESLVP
ncbi:MAG: glycosyltransferase family 4 protein [Bacillota bacterium]